MEKKLAADIVHSEIVKSASCACINYSDAKPITVLFIVPFWNALY